MAPATRRRWQFGLRSLFIGTTAAAIAVALMTWLDVPGDFVLIVAAIVAVLIEAVIHRRGMRWIMRRRRRAD